MELITDHLSRCIQTLESSLAMLEKAAPESVDYEVYRNAVVKGYKLALETSGKLLRKSLKEYTGSSRVVDELSYKDVMRQALKYGLLADQETVERWFAYRDNRNNTAHDYGVGFAHDTLTLLPGFLKDVHVLEKTLREKFGNA
jgi:nucleotidyltransferase substrate binding protein (TIGR01987 family)